jgi:ribonuclease HI
MAMVELMLFTDGSVNNRSNVGYGAYLAVHDHGLPLDSLKARVKVRRFAPTSSTKLELQTLLWAIGDIQDSAARIMIYTDSQNIIGLPGRRDRFEQSDYRSKNNKRLNHYALYQEFYRMTDQLNIEFVKLSGHKGSNKKDEIDRFFSLVDKASRNAMRGEDRRP